VTHRTARGRRPTTFVVVAVCLVVALTGEAVLDRLGLDALGLRGGAPASGDELAGGESGELLDRLVIAPEGPDAGYGRELFPHWVDADGDGCDTRSEVLIEESRSLAQVDRFGCTVIAGDWVSVYDGSATDDPAELEIDHVVALAEAWRSGAADWDGVRRRAFANDREHPGALVAVTAATNRAKGDSDPASWQPPDPAAWCTFATDWVTTKLRWGLTADAAEHDALAAMLRTC
jgi:hypothetical protein